MKKVLLIAALFSALFSEATHILGGEVSWECLPSGQYRFTIVLYRDCTGIPLSATVQTLSTNAPGVSSIACTKVATNYINKECGAPSCAGASVPYIGAVEQHIYRSSPITLTGPPPATGWRFTWNSCCRPGTTTNLLSPGGQGFTLRAMMYPYTPPGTSVPIIANPCYDNSPVFDIQPNMTFCAGNQSILDASVSDADHDSIFYSWAQPKVGGSAPPFTDVTWNTTSPNNYSYTNPFPDTAQHPNNSPAQLDSSSGLISFLSNTQGMFIYCISAKSYRNGQLIAETFRDLPILIKNCSSVSQCNSTPPTYSDVVFSWNDPDDSIYMVSSGSGGAVEDYRRHIKAKEGDSVKFVLDIFDTDSTTSCQLEEIRLSATASPYAFYNGFTGCMQPYSCPDLTSMNANGGFVDSLQNTVAFNWLIGCGNNLGPAEFIFKIENNSCPLPTIKIVKLTIDVDVDSPDHPEFDTVLSVFDPIKNHTNLVWTRPDTGVSFDQYILWHSTGGQPVILDSIKNYNDTTYNHQNPPMGLNRYWIRQVGSCLSKLDSVDINDSASVIILKNNIGIAENTFGISYYPQPMTDEVVFDGFENSGEVRIDMINAVGELVRSTKLNINGGKVKADVSELAAGVYVFVLFWDGHSSKIKLVKHE